MSDQPVAEAATFKTQESNIHTLSGIRTLDPSNPAFPPGLSSPHSITCSFHHPPVILPLALIFLESLAVLNELPSVTQYSTPEEYPALLQLLSKYNFASFCDV